TLASIPVPGRTRWTVFDPTQGVFFVNIADPAQIVVIDPLRPEAVVDRFEISDRGPHGLEIDSRQQRLYCACDGGKLVSVHSESGSMLDVLELSGPPDVISVDGSLGHLYIAIGDPGVIDVIDTVRWTRLETVTTEPGAHTLAIDDGAHTIYGFLPQTHRAILF